MEELANIRKEIDIIDKEIIELLAKRLSLMPKISRYKKIKNLEICDSKREEELLNSKLEIGKEKGLREEYIQDIFKRIIEESHNSQKNLR